MVPNGRVRWRMLPLDDENVSEAKVAPAQRSQSKFVVFNASENATSDHELCPRQKSLQQRAQSKFLMKNVLENATSDLKLFQRQK